MPRIRTVTMWVVVLELIGLFFVFRGYRARDHSQGIALGDLFRPGAVMAPMNPGALSPSPAEDSLPEDPDGRVMWFSRQYSVRYRLAERQMALDEGADIDLLPREWPQAKYIADAAAYPGVETYFLAYLRYLGKAKEHYPALMDSIATSTIVQAKLRPVDSAGVIKELTQALASKSEINREMFDNGEAYGQAALRLHYFLASVGSRVSYDSAADVARFRVESERQSVSPLLADLRNRAAKLGAAARAPKN
jgi:hypothetical protein